MLHRFLFSRLAHHRKACALILLLQLGSVALDLSYLALLYPLLSIVLGSRAPLWGPLGRIVEGDAVFAGLAALLSIILFRGALATLAARMADKLAGVMVVEEGDDILRRYSRAPYQELIRHKPRVLLQPLLSTQRLLPVFADLPKFLGEFVRVLAVVGLWLALDLRLTLLFLMAVSFVPALLFWMIRRGALRRERERIGLLNEQGSLFADWIRLVRSFAVYGVRDKQRLRIAETGRLYADSVATDLTRSTLMRQVIEAAMLCAMLGIIVYVRSTAGERLPERLSLLGVLGFGLIRVLPSLVMISRYALDAGKMLPHLERIASVESPPVRSGRRPYRGLTPGLRLDRLGFGYPGRPLLYEGLDGLFAEGSVSVVTGRSGSGKSTLLSLLLGVCAPTSGRILVGGTDLGELDLDDYHRRVAFVDQDGSLLHGSAGENITFGRAGFSQERIEAAARAARIHDDIAALPRGYDTPIGEMGLMLSAGQRQRVAIARALLGDPELLIFDEAASAVDPGAAEAVFSAIREAARGRTVIYAAHEPPPQLGADMVFSLGAHGMRRVS